MLINSPQKFRIEKRKTYKEDMLSPKNKAFSPNSAIDSQNNNHDIKRPLKTNHSDLSFEGLFSSRFLYKQLKDTYSLQEFYEFADKYVGKMGRELFNDITVKNRHLTSQLVRVDGDKITLSKKSIPHLAWDGILYPFKILPADMLNGMVGILGKIPGLKKWSAKTLEKPFFKNIRQRSKIDSKVNSLQGLITFRSTKINEALEKYAQNINKKVSELSTEEKSNVIAQVDQKLQSQVMQRQLKQFDPSSGNYDTKHERALNRLVSGMPPAVFLATDAYNLSRMMDDDSKAAEKERKTRFKQETTRILSSGYLTLITMGAFQKFINSSKMGIVLTTGLTVLITEMISRLSNGKHITRLTPEQARKENERLNTPEAKIKPQEEQKNSPVSLKGGNQERTKEQQKPLLSFGTVMKASALILSLGIGIRLSKNIPSIQKAAFNYFEKLKIKNPEKYQKLDTKDITLNNAVSKFESEVLYKPFTNLYKKLTTEKYIIKPEQLNEVVKILDENGFKVLAKQYDKIAKTGLKTLNDGTQIIDFGTRDKKVKPLVNFIIAPFKFMWNTVTLPYWMVVDKILGAIPQKGGAAVLKALTKNTKAKKPMTDLQAVANSFDKIYKQATKKNFNAEQFKDFVQVNLLKAWNIDSLSSVSNAELSNLAKTAASIATIWFLMTDNYNMVMLKSNGNDKNGADTKFKERFVQEGSRLFYQTLLIDLFNSTFRNSYNASLLGMSWVTLADTTLGEMLTRSSVGTPIKKHTRDELIEIETKQNNSTGFKKKYYNFMQRLTGKRSIKSYEVQPKNKPHTESNIPEVKTGEQKQITLTSNTIKQEPNGIEKFIQNAR